MNIHKIISSTPTKPLKFIRQGLFYCLLVGFISACNIPTTYAKSNHSSLGHAYPYSIVPPDEGSGITEQFMNVQLLGAIALKSLVLNGIEITELSGIAWDADEKVLYAVSDEGYLYHLKLTFKKGRLKDMQVIFATTLKDKHGKPVLGKYSDSEGLSIVYSNNGKSGDTQLIISFENKPRVAYYSVTGKLLHNVKIPKRLTKRRTYRSKNKALESVVIHPIYGVITAAEYPIKADAITVQSIYSETGKIWHFPASEATSSAITGMEVMPNGDILILERAFSNPFVPIVINLRQLKLEECNKEQMCKIETVAHFTGADGWLLDNFEGLTHYQGNQYLMVSDDNGNILQKTLMILFEINRP